MMQFFARITGVRQAAPGIFVLTFTAPEIAERITPGQFVNIKVNDFNVPLLRRPFSVYTVTGNEVSIIFNVIGLGTSILSAKRPGDLLDIIGPLGRPYDLASEFTTAILVAGGLGVAPLPMITSALKDTAKDVVTFLGARSADQLVTTHLTNIRSATDDGSEGYHGTVVDLLRVELNAQSFHSPKIFACGPHPMLRALAALAEERGIVCEISLESSMACGIGICQGCPVEIVGGERKYALICKEGTVFDTRTVVIS
jgi:dihydroorotate dehydrogenase electron transfer subunit